MYSKTVKHVFQGTCFENIMRVHLHRRNRKKLCCYNCKFAKDFSRKLTIFITLPCRGKLPFMLRFAANYS